VFGRLKLVLVALVLMPSAAFAADHAPRHAPGTSVDSTVVATKIAAPAAETAEPSRKHRPSAKADQPAPSTIATFLDRLRDEAVAAAPAGAKQAAAALSVAAAPARPVGHQRN
jgi:hypothetical protein